MLIPIEELRRVADMAPSVLNTRPWSLRFDDNGLVELSADWTRRLDAVDPRHRELVISCGAALFNVRMAIRKAGHDVACSLIPIGRAENGACPHCGVPGLLALAEIGTSRIHQATEHEERLYEAIPFRHTVREPFTRPIGLSMAVELERAARTEGIYALLLNKWQAKHLLAQYAVATEELAGDAAHREQLQEWTENGSHVRRGYGVPIERLSPKPRNRRHPPVRDLGLSWDDTRHDEKFERSPTLIALKAKTDTPPDWMRLGQGLQRLLLTATRYGVEASLLTQQSEVEDWIEVHQGAGPWSPSPERIQLVVRLGHSEWPLAT